MATKSFKQKLIKAIKSPKSLLKYISYRFIIFIRPIITDKLYLKLLFYIRLGQWPDLNNPKTFNEKLLWLKLYDHNPEYTVMADKVKAKEWVAERIGWEHIIPTLGVWEKAEDINFDSLPEKFVIKCNHNSGTGMYICQDKSKIDIEKVRKNLALGLKENYYAGKLEWSYKYIPRRILAEKFLETDIDSNGEPDLRDYKFFCFNGCVRFFKIDFNRNTNHQANYYTPNGKLMTLGECVCPPDFSKKLKIPSNLNQMIGFAEKLSTGFPFLRVDFYSVENSIYFGELTFYPAAGLGKFTEDKWDLELGEWLKLPRC